MLTETVTIEDRVLRFERAKSTFNAQSAASSAASSAVAMQQPQVAIQQQTAPIRPFFHPLQPAGEDSDEGGSSSISPASQTSFKAFVGRLNGDLITQRKLLRRFQRHGHITDIELFKRNLDGTPRQEAFAFVSYLREEQLFSAIREENDQVWLGTRIKCCKALPKRDLVNQQQQPFEAASMPEGTFYYPPAGPIFYQPADFFY